MAPARRENRSRAATRAAIAAKESSLGLFINQSLAFVKLVSNEAPTQVVAQTRRA